MATQALSDRFRTYLEGVSPETANQIMIAVQKAARNVEPSAASGKKISKTQRKKQTAAAALATRAPSSGPLRPLNSWMAFRKFYNGMLAPRTQKAISKLLTVLWRADPFQAKWAVLAKAYSIVRGELEKKDAPLDEFLIICAPLVGVIPPEEYLQKMGWQLSPPQDGNEENVPQITRLFTPDLDAFPAEVTTTTLSVDDLVNHCRALGMGYANSNSNGSPHASTQGSLTMVSKPTATTTDNEVDVEAEATYVAYPSPDEDLRQHLLNALNSPQASQAPEVTLDQASLGLQYPGDGVPYSNSFDPSGTLGINFDPALPNITVEDGGVWDGFDIGVLAPVAQDNFAFNEEADVEVEWDTFMN